MTSRVVTSLCAFAAHLMSEKKPISDYARPKKPIPVSQVLRLAYGLACVGYLVIAMIATFAWSERVRRDAAGGTDGMGEAAAIVLVWLGMGAAIAGAWFVRRWRKGG